ncbi:MAG: hypothetical protein K2Y37_23845 [Pirellulales bacterium]|nr:hypothetical protein [Pirellulales bacterium]
MPRFVALYHDCPDDRPRPSHWDFMLEADGVLRTWALERAPDSAADQIAEQLPDHRIAYLDYEGPVSGDRGEVTRWDAGEYRWLTNEPATVVIDVVGRRLRGVVTLTCASAQLQRWRFSLVPASR